jgi:hypothetical protein
MTNPILPLLAAAKAQLERIERKINDAERERDVLRAQVAAYQEAARAVDAVSDGNSAPVLPEKPYTVERTPKVMASQAGWNKVFQALQSRFADGFGYDQIVEAADNVGVPYKRASLRTKMMNYANNNLVERVDNGCFRITLQGQSFFGIDTGFNENGAANAAPDADEAPTSSNLPLPGWAN